MDFIMHDDPIVFQQTATAVEINNQALQLYQAGDLQGAERLYLRVLRMKERDLGNNTQTTALTRNALGELYLEMGKLDEAEAQLTNAIDVRKSLVPPGVFDTAVSIENLARVYEARGDLNKAREIRLSNGEDAIACGHEKCPGMTFSLSQLSVCSACKGIFYCSKKCQIEDWKKRHKKNCKKASPASA